MGQLDILDTVHLSPIVHLPIYLSIIFSVIQGIQKTIEWVLHEKEHTALYLYISAYTTETLSFETSSSSKWDL